MDILIKKPRVLIYDENAPDGKYFTIEEKDVAIRGDSILYVGVPSDCGGTENAAGGVSSKEQPGSRAGDGAFVPEVVIDGRNRLVIPGLINAHTHNYMTLFRNLADDVPFGQWLFEGVMPHEDRMLPEDAYWGALLGIMEMLRSGTTCFNDMQMHIHQTPRAVVDSGIRAVVGRGISNTEGPSGLGRRLKEAAEEIERWRGNDLLSFTIAPHAPYTCDTEGLKACVAEAEKRGLRLHIHLSESKQEVADMRERCGMTPIAYAESIGLFSVPAIVAHAVQAEPDDIRILARHGVSVVTNPASNMKLGNGFAPVPELLSAGVNVAIGTDGAASNNGLNLFREMSLLSLIHKGSHEDAVSVSAQEALRMATVNGAKALGLNTGRVAAGCKADLAILSLDCPQMRPFNNIISGLAYAANGSEVETVIVNGEIVVKDGHCTNIDEERVYFETSDRLR
jgi:5-methylthioadenosine/S-adenosylhomocysteine deaminase